jgi:integrase
MGKAKLTTDRQVAALKPGERAYETPIDGARRLIVRTFPSGVRSFEVRYVTLAGVRRRLSLGEYPGLKLSDAIRRALTHGVAVSDGKDPAGEKAAERRRARTGETLKNLADAYFKASEKGLHGGRGRPKRPSTIKVERVRFDRHIKPELGSVRFTEIGRSDVKQFMRKLAAEGALAADTVASVGRTLGSILAFAVHEERLDLNPASGLTQPLALKPRDRMFSEKSLAAIWKALSAVVVTPDGDKVPIRAIPLALKLSMLTLARRQDVAGAQWDEIDLKARTWAIPAGRHKSRKVHVVPLTATAIATLNEAAKLQPNPGAPARHVFPSPADAKVHITEHAVTRAMTRLCEALALPHGSPHDFRRTGATLLTSERGNVRRFIVSKILAHAAHEGATVTEVYDRNEYLAEKRSALTIWEGLLLEIVGERVAPSNVEAFKKGAA